MEDLEFGISIDDGSSYLSSFSASQNSKVVSLRDWQRRGIDFFFNEAGGNAMYQCATGTGKSMFTTKLIEMILSKNPDYKVVIVVPKNVILESGWYKELYDAGFGIKDIGVYYGNIKEIAKITLTNMQNLDRLPLDIFQVLILDECFVGSTKVTVMHKNKAMKNDNGQICESTIKSLVEHKSKVKVLTFNTKTKEFELKKITDWIKVPVKRETLTLTFNNGKKITCTPEQEFYNGQKYVKASDINVGDVTIYFGKDNNFIHNENTKQLVINAILGDGSIGINSKRGRLGFNCIHKEYMEFKKSFTEEFESNKYISSCINKGYKTGIIYRYGTKLYKDIRDFYLTYKKEGIEFILEQLNDLGLAMWFYDDGCFNKRGNGGNLHTEGFSYEDNVKICEYFNRLGFSCSVRLNRRDNNKDLYYIALKKQAVLKCFNIMKKFPIKCFEYKFKRFNNNINYLPLNKPDVVVIPDSLNNVFSDYNRSDKRPCFVKCVSKEKNLEKEYVYDLKVEDNHNFIANGMLVHNCHNYATKRLLEIIDMDFKYRIGLSATLERQDNKHWDLLKLFNYNVFNYNSKEALADGILNSFNFTNIGVDMDFESFLEYKNISTELNAVLKAGGGFNKIMRGTNGLKFRMLGLMGRRKNLVSNYERKFDVIKNIISKNKDKKIIVFNEYNSTSNKLKWALLDIGVSSVIIHSGIANDKREEGLKSFKNGGVNVILTSKVLDEGWNVPAVDLGIIAAGNSTSRQTVQRMGRVLRKKDHDSELYQIYCNNTVEEDYAIERAKIFKELSSNYHDYNYNLEGDMT